MQKTLKIDQIKPNPDNPRIIKDDKFKKLVKSLQEFPEMTQIRRVVVNKDLMILGGNMRWRAAKEAGWTDIPVEIVDLPEDKQREFIIKDNVSGGEWDWDTLANEWSKEQLDDWGVDIDNWTSDEIVEDDVPELDDTSDPVSKLGEVYQLGRHRLMCGNATKIEDVEKLMDGNKADMVFTDPPYGVDYSGGIQFTNSGVKKGQRDKLIADDTTQIIADTVPIMAMFCDGPIYTWFAHNFERKLIESIDNIGGQRHAVIIWVKSGGYGAMNANYKQKHEPCLYWKAKGNILKWSGKSTENTIWEIDKDGLNKLHPTQKPVALAVRAINNREALKVLDLFGGSGSTLIACEQTDRTCYMMELDEKYVDVIRKRYHKFITGSEEGWEKATPVIK
jgi:DNA modification methylase